MPSPQEPVANPFALLLDPQAIFRAIESSERLERLQSRICRPLDRPLIPATEAAADAGSGDAAASADAAIDDCRDGAVEAHDRPDVC